MHLRKALLEAGDQVQKVLERQIGMQAADDVKLRDRLAISRGSGLEGFFEAPWCRRRASLSLRPKAHRRQAATQTLVGLRWRLTLK